MLGGILITAISVAVITTSFTEHYQHRCQRAEARERDFDFAKFLRRAKGAFRVARRFERGTRRLCCFLHGGKEGVCMSQSSLKKKENSSIDLG